ncbi:MAG: hypothetical protein L3J62_08640 [Gammaproteobacteria bacterium]|nr:hypothetical protein [Gammaproteobacteria bacterium]MCF6230842.1 hypothetical protein [Gammaproteobacteria bacterium]
MDSLRISLIIIGIIILLALYFGSQLLSKKRQLKQQPRQTPRFDKAATGDQQTIPESTPVETSEAPIVAEREAVSEPKKAVVEVAQPEITTPDDIAAAPTAAKPSLPAVIALHIVAKQGDFAGADLVKAANLAAMRYGEMEIFHFLGATQGAITFSMANMLEPGTFDLDNLNGFTTPGVLLFMESDLQDDLATSLNSMAKVARNICERLDAQLCDDHRRPFDLQQLDAWRADLIRS